MEIVGSYRRGKPDSGDIDVILTGNANDYVNLINVLIEKGDIRSVITWTY